MKKFLCIMFSAVLVSSICFAGCDDEVSRANRELEEAKAQADFFDDVYNQKKKEYEDFMDAYNNYNRYKSYID